MTLKKHSKSYYDLHEVMDEVEKRNNIEIRDYLGSFKKRSEELAIWKKKLETELGKTYEELHKEWGSSNENWAKYDMKWALDGREEEKIPYCDWWHFFVDCHEISNGCHIYLSFADLLEYAQEKDAEDNETSRPWRSEITQMFIDVVGEDYHDFEVSW